MFIALYFRNLDREGAIELKDWIDSPQSASDVTARDHRSAFFEFCRDHESDIAHFACHAVAKEYSRDSYIELSRDLCVRLEDMSVEDYRLAGSPFVFMNACGTGVRDPSKTSDFVRGFLLSAGWGVVATECDVPDLFASVFIEDVYARILKGESSRVLCWLPAGIS
jgi:CHAT domain-containing protein